MESITERANRIREEILGHGTDMQTAIERGLHGAMIEAATLTKRACESVATDYELATPEKEVGTMFLSYDEIEKKYHTGTCPIAIREINIKKVLSGE